jgi:arylamine N-acetyltransferase
MQTTSCPELILPPALRERVLTALGLRAEPEPTLAGLRLVYSAWCRRVPFDNVRKLVHVRSGNRGPLPGSTPEDFFNGWLQFGAGGTCWSGAGALHALLASLGFEADRGLATMLVAPGLPPNHGTVRVTIDTETYLVDSSMLHGDPLRLDPSATTQVVHPAWGLRCAPLEGGWLVSWRPLHRVDGFDCRLESFDQTGADFRRRYDATRGWSPFNYEVTARANRQENVVGLAFGHAVTLRNDGGAGRVIVSHDERVKILIEQIGLTEEIVRRLPRDVATPPPPWSETAQLSR